MTDIEPVVEPNAPPVEARPPTRKSALTKEVPPFKWKLVGYSDGLTVTLLKSVEKSDIEAQMQRLEEEGYYRDLQIYPIDAKVPPDPLAGKIAKEKAAVAKAEKKAAAAAAKADGRRAATARAEKRSASATKKAAAKSKSAKKKVVKKEK